MKYIDLDRGVFQRKHSDGYLVTMYRDAPGVYFNEKGVEVPESAAEAAGFDVRTYRVARAKNKLKAEAVAKIEEDFAKAEVRALEDAEKAELEAEKLAEKHSGNLPDPEPEPEPENKIAGDGPFAGGSSGKSGKGGRGGR